MKMLFIKLIIVVGILLAVPYYMMGGAGLPDFLQQMMPGQKPKQAAVPENISNVVTDKDVTVYKWVDEQGHVNFSSVPPVGLEAEVKQLKPDMNILPAMKLPEKEEEKEQGSRVTRVGEGLQNPYSKEGVEKLVDDAKNVGDMLNNRFEAQKEVIDGVAK